MGNRTPPFEKTWRAEVKRLWRETHQAFDLDGEATATLKCGCDCLEQFFRARDTLLVEGAFFETTSGQKKKHPCVEIQKNALAGYLASMRSLNLEWDPDRDPKRGPGRPSPWA